MVRIFPRSDYLFVDANAGHSWNRGKGVLTPMFSGTQTTRLSAQTMLFSPCFHVLIDIVSLRSIGEEGNALMTTARWTPLHCRLCHSSERQIPAAGLSDHDKEGHPPPITDRQ